MSTMTRYSLIGVLLILPIAVLVGVGAYSLWETGRYAWLWWLMPLCWGIAGILIRLWKTQLVATQQTVELPHLTPRDEIAAEIVAAEQRRVDEFAVTELTNPQFYVRVANELAMKICHVYQPNATDAVSRLSVLEVLAAAHLVAEDLEEWFAQNVPAGHLVSIGQWRLLSKAPGWYRTVANAGWAVSIFFNPAVLGKLIVSRTVIDPMSNQVQENLLGAFYSLFVRQVGLYLIEMNSGRLKGGSERYRQTMASLASAGKSGPQPTESTSGSVPLTIRLGIVGQVKAGKSSLVNALLGEKRAAVDVLPQTSRVERYALSSPDTGDRIEILDTPGYGPVDQSAREIADLREAARTSDLLLLVIDATTPAKEQDRKQLQQLQDWFASQSHLKPPPIVAVLTHIDRLSPVREWSPPYLWRTPSRPKEQAIRGAVDYLEELFGERLVATVPVCLEATQIYGIDEELWPVMSAILGEARAASAIRSLHADLARERWTKLWTQVWGAAQQMAPVLKQVATNAINANRPR